MRKYLIGILILVMLLSQGCITSLRVALGKKAPRHAHGGAVMLGTCGDAIIGYQSVKSKEKKGVKRIGIMVGLTLVDYLISWNLYDKPGRHLPDKPSDLPPVTEANPVYKHNINLSGSALSVRKAISQSTLIITVQAQDFANSGTLVQEGMNYHKGKFTVIQVLHGTIEQKEIELSYRVCWAEPEKERAPLKREHLILFIDTEHNRIIKVLRDTEDNIKLVKDEIKKLNK